MNMRPSFAWQHLCQSLLRALGKVVLLPALLAGQAAWAADPYAAMSPFKCEDTSLACATAATPAWDSDGRLWLAWVANGAVSVARSTDQGRSFAAPVVIGRHGGAADIGPDARPQIVVDARNRIMVVYGVFKDDRWNGRLLVSRSDDGGQHFSTPQPLMEQTAGQRFAAMTLAPDGRVFIAWIDKRLVAAAAQKGKKMPGAAIAYAWSNDAGASFTPSRLAYSESCECCRIAVAMRDHGQPVLVFRAVLDQKVRDHVAVTFDGRETPGPMRRVADDQWATDACPHHGPALAVGADATYHVAWYTQGQARRGVFYARSTDEGKTFSSPMRLGQEKHQAGRPSLLAQGSTVWMAWKEFDGQETSAYVRSSRDAGLTWSAPVAVARSVGYSDHPILIAQQHKAYLSWLRHDEGYRLIELETP